jgi:pimeloyl-ACP methyl ester carboxylesterase
MIRRRMQGHGLGLSVVEWGSEGAPLVVLLHGFQDAAESFDNVAQTLVQRGFRVVAPDLRGFGDSDRVPPGGYYYFPDYVFDVAEILDAVSPSAPVRLVGHSMGGTVATLVAGTFPDRIAALALIEGVGPPSVPGDFAVERMAAWIEGVRKQRGRPEKSLSMEEAVSRLRISHPNLPVETVARRTAQLTRLGDDGRYVWAFDPLHRTRSPLEFQVERWRTFARRITARTLCIGGGPTGFHPDDEAERIAVIPGARSIEIDGAGHMIHWTAPATLATTLADFFGRD